MYTQIQINMQQKKTIYYVEVWINGETHYHQLEPRQYNELGYSIILDLINNQRHIVHLNKRVICYDAATESEVAQLITDLKLLF